MIPDRAGGDLAPDGEHTRRPDADQPAQEILQADLAFLDAIGMKEHLSSNRKNGLDAMVKKMKQYAEGMSA